MSGFLTRDLFCFGGFFRTFRKNQTTRRTCITIYRFTIQLPPIAVQMNPLGRFCNVSAIFSFKSRLDEAEVCFSVNVKYPSEGWLINECFSAVLLFTLLKTVFPDCSILHFLSFGRIFIKKKSKNLLFS